MERDRDQRERRWEEKPAGEGRRHRKRHMIVLLFFFFGLFRTTFRACGGSQGRGRINAVAAGLCQSHGHSKEGSELPSVMDTTAQSNTRSLTH